MTESGCLTRAIAEVADHDVQMEAEVCIWKLNIQINYIMVINDRSNP